MENKVFSNLFNFSYKRSFKEAIGFYIVYALLLMLVGGVLAAITRVAFPIGDVFDQSIMVGQISATLVTLGLAVLILMGKGLLGRPLNMVLMLLSAVLSYFVGGILGVAVLAYLTTL